MVRGREEQPRVVGSGRGLGSCARIVGSDRKLVVVPHRGEPDLDASEPATIDLRVGDLVAGGAALGRDGEGRVVLVEGALPGELVTVDIRRRRPRLLEGSVVAVLEPSEHRVEPPCPMIVLGCGGCDLQHVQPVAQPHLKAAIVADALRHLGRLSDPVVTTGPTVAPWAFRTTVRAAVDPAGRAGFRRARSREVVVPETCAIVHPLVADVMANGRFPGASEVVIRAGVASGERVAVVVPEGGIDPAGVVEAATVPHGVVVAGPDGRCQGAPDVVREAVVHEVVAGRPWRISAGSFFQSRPDGAGVLAERVVHAVEGVAQAGMDEPGTLVDLYSGVGLLAGVLRSAGWSGPMVAVEREGEATGDAEVNLAGDGIEVVTTPVERWSPVPADIVVADPARSGLGRQATELVGATGATGVVLVSCDAASLGRDAALLAAQGYSHRGSEVIDMFVHSHHVEVISSFVRS